MWGFDRVFFLLLYKFELLFFKKKAVIFSRSEVSLPPVSSSVSSQPLPHLRPSSSLAWTIAIASYNLLTFGLSPFQSPSHLATTVIFLKSKSDPVTYLLKNLSAVPYCH